MFDTQKSAAAQTSQGKISRMRRGGGADTFELIDLFSGCGGLSAGFLTSGHFRHVYAADTDVWANGTFERNIGPTPEPVDLRRLAADPRRRAAWADKIRGQATGRVVLAGGPPCQGFSSHVKVRGDRHERNGLVASFVSLALALQPEIILIENVPDLFATRNWDLFAAARRKLQRAGYIVRARIINMAQLGVPQERFRAIVIAAASRPTFPAPSRRSPEDYSTVKEWIGHLNPVANGETDPDDAMHQASRHRRSTIRIIEQVPRDGGSRPEHVGPECLRRARSEFGGYTDVYSRLAWSEPAPTITARCRTPSCGRFVHPDQNRGLTAREAALLQTFPKTWHFIGPFDDRYKQIGNAVPPLAAEALARHIAAGWATATKEVGVAEIEDEPIGQSFSVLIPGIRRRGGVL